MSAFALKLLLAHLLGDFLLQPDSWVAQKRQRKQRSPLLYAHVAVHFLIMFALLGFDLSYWPALIVIVVSHYFIDLLKLHLESSDHKSRLFLLDQLAHLLVIAGVTYSYHPFSIAFFELLQPGPLLFVSCLVFLGPVAAILMRLIMSRWVLPEDKENDSLPQAGKYIGMLERLLVFAFIVLQQWPAIGWLIAAKSILRFSDLSRAKDRKLTEYVLIGTLLSFSLSIVTGIVYLYFQDISLF
ncbi:DUF3307 domain-containing protein [Salinimicrobium tongyeongense]|uniref:DUF3307 domain-containing protein n=1 Tax=Salinimicrobium tongyeongense TaxID=2809707 RepID=A0ABY6NQQ2_9FLAO|nr:DUF3307 domain-containing protein [Salinimicrobium tongyeongense]UZH55245.1 DUF3307 domain-containing protein [Salinimicrobium tongyeongense]